MRLQSDNILVRKECVKILSSLIIYFIREVRLIFQGKSFVERHLKVQCAKRVVSGILIVKLAEGLIFK